MTPTLQSTIWASNVYIDNESVQTRKLSESETSPKVNRGEKNSGHVNVYTWQSLPQSF